MGVLELGLQPTERRDDRAAGRTHGRRPGLGRGIHAGASQPALPMSPPAPSWFRSLLAAGPLLVLLPALSSCVSLVQAGATDRAYKYYRKGDYVTALRMLTSAESYGRMPEPRHAEICYLKGRCLEGLGNRDEAVMLYEYLIKTYPATEFAARARGRIQELRSGSGPPAPPPPRDRPPEK
jgi:tetratricopeptide (TPR) repeat protein